MKNRFVSIIKWTAIVIGWTIFLFWLNEQPKLSGIELVLVGLVTFCLWRIEGVGRAILTRLDQIENQAQVRADIQGVEAKFRRDEILDCFKALGPTQPNSIAELFGGTKATD